MLGFSFPGESCGIWHCSRVYLRAVVVFFRDGRRSTSDELGFIFKAEAMLCAPGLKTVENTFSRCMFCISTLKILCRGIFGSSRCKSSVAGAVFGIPCLQVGGSYSMFVNLHTAKIVATAALDGKLDWHGDR